jgi:hypothetical protein
MPWVAKLPDGEGWSWELKLDGYRLVVARNAAVIALYSRNGNLLNRKYPAIVEALQALPADTTIDGELVALDDAGRPAFKLLQKPATNPPEIRYFRLTGCDCGDASWRGHLSPNAAKFSPACCPRASGFAFRKLCTLRHRRCFRRCAQGLGGVVAKRKDFHEAAEDADQSWTGVRHWRLHAGSARRAIHYRGRVL